MRVRPVQASHFGAVAVGALLRTIIGDNTHLDHLKHLADLRD